MRDVGWSLLTTSRHVDTKYTNQGSTKDLRWITNDDDESTAKQWFDSKDSEEYKLLWYNWVLKSNTSELPVWSKWRHLFYYWFRLFVNLKDTSSCCQLLTVTRDVSKFSDSIVYDPSKFDKVIIRLYQMIHEMISKSWQNTQVITFYKRIPSISALCERWRASDAAMGVYVHNANNRFF